MLRAGLFIILGNTIIILIYFGCVHYFLSETNIISLSLLKFVLCLLGSFFSGVIVEYGIDNIK